MPDTSTFGIEIEGFGISLAQARDALANAGLDCQVEGYNQLNRPYWKVTTDASVTNGFEVVSPVLCGESGLEQAKIALDELRAAGARVDRRCGLHVHLGAENLSAADIATVVRRYGKFEEQIDGWMAPSRRGDANRFCLSVRSFLQSGSTVSDRLQGGTVAEVCRAFGTRYLKVNLEAWERHRTIEFRQHGGTVEAEKALPWIRFCLGLGRRHRLATPHRPWCHLGAASQTRLAGDQSPPQRHHYALINRAVDAEDRVFAGIDERTAAYLRARTVHFARREQAAA